MVGEGPVRLQCLLLEGEIDKKATFTLAHVEVSITDIHPHTKPPKSKPNQAADPRSKCTRLKGFRKDSLVVLPSDLKLDQLRSFAASVGVKNSKDG
jgi:hypothetical protein